MHETFVILYNSPSGLKMEEASGHNEASAVLRAKELAATGGQALVLKVSGAALFGPPATAEAKPSKATRQ